MLAAETDIKRDMELQEELLLQYEAIIEEMSHTTGRERMTYIERASALLRRLSAHTRATAAGLRRTPPGPIGKFSA